jgi:hypothetical protein
MLLCAHERGFNPTLVCFDSWYGSIENLKLVRSLDWHFLTRLKSNRQINVNRSGLQAVSEAGLCGSGTIVWLKGFGEVKVLRERARTARRNTGRRANRNEKALPNLRGALRCIIAPSNNSA